MNHTNASKQLIGQSPVSPMVYNVIGITMTMLFVLALVEDITVLITYKRNSKLHDKTNIWIISLIVCDFLIVLNSFPIVIVTSFSMGYTFGVIVCKWDGFIVTVLGITSIYILTGLSAYRYILMFNSTMAKKLTKPNIVTCVILCFAFGLFWGITPLIGWGSFSVEGIGVSCAPNWRSQATGDRRYMVAMYISALIIPLLIIGFCYCRILFKIWRGKQSRRVSHKQRQVKRDIHVTISVAFTILSFMISWMPYAVVSLLEGFFQISIHSISPMLVQLPCLMAKTACIWNPIVYVCHNGRYRNAYIQTFGFLQRFSFSHSSDTCESSNSRNTTHLYLRSSQPGTSAQHLHVFKTTSF